MHACLRSLVGAWRHLVAAQRRGDWPRRGLEWPRRGLEWPARKRALRAALIIRSSKPANLAFSPASRAGERLGQAVSICGGVHQSATTAARPRLCFSNSARLRQPSQLTTSTHPPTHSIITIIIHRGKMGKDTRVTYKRRHAYATKSNRRQVLRTPGT